eukprot:CAMPEP_0173435636 /NCGR_PEP_ID=MMETSP1357-20121228/15506_1 /TAXON_ID=77926 /ORGANISM="Hemiselmis rufescens, Strain PCC563" /LENGTH=76 /DNA_ID=CAMNT_0014400647 /DNA_START=156 /DNA_END=382 /DNA_ORIENTATION=+
MSGLHSPPGSSGNEEEANEGDALYEHFPPIALNEEGRAGAAATHNGAGAATTHDGAGVAAAEDGAGAAATHDGAGV